MRKWKGGNIAEVIMGTSGWWYDHWRGIFSPSDLGKARVPPSRDSFQASCVIEGFSLKGGEGK